jgi:hypothetical protein
VRGSASRKTTAEQLKDSRWLTERKAHASSAHEAKGLSTLRYSQYSALGADSGLQLFVGTCDGRTSGPIARVSRFDLLPVWKHRKAVRQTVEQ